MLHVRAFEHLRDVDDNLGVMLSIKQASISVMYVLVAHVNWIIPESTNISLRFAYVSTIVFNYALQ